MGRDKVVLVALIALVLACMHPNVELQVRSQLDAFGQITQAAYGFAVDACLLRQNSLVELAESGKHPEAVSEFRAITERCKLTNNAFRQIIAAHEEAILLVESGHIEQAQQHLDNMKLWYAQIRESAPPAPVEERPPVQPP